MVIDIKKKRPVLANITGGLSGPAVRPVALKMVWEAAGAVDIPVIGIGGIATWQDAVEFMLAGATGVQVGSAIFGNPRAPLDVICGLEHYACSEGIASIRDMVGLARKNI
jgi:dihydroorotate dehydrogenase (NAD+) catalytic subunit